jgi:anti-anti-sigma factor
MSNRLLYAIKNHDLYIKIKGAGTAKDYKPLKDSVMDIIKAPFLNHVEFDLSEVYYLDSTFIGLLLGINKILKKEHKEEIEICNVSDELLSLFEEVEVAHLFKITSKPDTTEEQITYVEISSSSQTNVHDILEAHGHLTDLCEANRHKFALLSRVLKTSRCK